MPFKSEKQRRYLYSQKPEVAKKFAVDSAKKGKIIKLKGGGADMGDPGKAQERADSGYGSTAGVDRSKVGEGSQYARNVAAKQAKPKTTSNFFNPITTGMNLVGSLTANIPGLGFGLDFAKKAATGIEDARRAKRAKGEYFLTSKKIMPINRDFYRQYGRKLNTKVGSLDEPYMKAAGVIGFQKPNRELNSSNPNTQLCPDGTRPPCKSPTTQIKNPVSTPNTFLSGFQSYDDGGEVIISGNVDKDLL